MDTISSNRSWGAASSRSGSTTEGNSSEERLSPEYDHEPVPFEGHEMKDITLSLWKNESNAHEYRKTKDVSTSVVQESYATLLGKNIPSKIFLFILLVTSL